MKAVALVLRAALCALVQSMHWLVKRSCLEGVRICLRLS